MALTECGKGHIYDADLYSICPYCNSGTSFINFGTATNEGQTVAPGMGVGRLTESDSQFVKSAAPVMESGTTTESDSPFNRTVAPGMGFGKTAESDSQFGRTVAEINPRIENEPIQHTVAPDFMRKKEEIENKTVAVFKKNYNIEPVVGWLVCIDGPEKGKDFHLWARINSIGRNENMDVCLKGDKTVSKDSHAKLAYDPKHNKFHIVPGNSVNYVYLNDEPVYTPMPLQAYDLIELGECKLLFVPFCNDHFTWTQGLVN